MSEHDLRALPNVGPAIAKKLMRLGIEQPGDLRGQDPERLFNRLSDLDGRRHDPCLLDTFVAAVDHANGAPARPWWYYSRQRKAAESTAAQGDAHTSDVHTSIEEAADATTRHDRHGGPGHGPDARVLPSARSGPAG